HYKKHPLSPVGHLGTSPRPVTTAVGNPEGEEALQPAAGTSPPSRTYPAFPRLSILGAVGVALLVVWGLWWKSSLRHNHLVGGHLTWVEVYHYLGVDFLNNYRASRHWLAGGDPYREPFGDPLGRKLCYPPAVLPAFAWCNGFSPRSALRL